MNPSGHEEVSRDISFDKKSKVTSVRGRIPFKAGKTALSFLRSLSHQDLSCVCFTDNLVTISDLGREIGEFTISIEPARYLSEECFLIHANSHGSIDKVPCGTSIQAFVNKHLETLDQQQNEYIKLENNPLDRKTFVTKQEDQFYVSRIISQGEEVQRKSIIFSLEEMKGFISEGANMLLQRLLVIKRIANNLQFLSFDSDLFLCPTTYKTLDERRQVIAGSELPVIGLERTIHCQTDAPTTWQSFFTEDGHLTSRVQLGSPVKMKLVRLPQPLQEIPRRYTYEKQPLNWEEDIQLYSKFLDRKEELKAEHAAYMQHHPELKALLGDFLQFLLLRKPDDVIAFAAEFFSSFTLKSRNENE